MRTSTGPGRSSRTTSKGAAFRQHQVDERLCYLNTGVPGQAPGGGRHVVDMPWFRWVNTPEDVPEAALA